MTESHRDAEDIEARLTIRDETPADAEAICAVTRAAFEPLEISNDTEHLIVDALRKAGALTVSLVAEVDGHVVGHVAVSPVKVSDGTEGWFGLGPVSVRPEFQRKGIGGALIEHGVSRLRAMGARGCCLVGHPGYYGRFGFRNVRGFGVEGVPAEVFFALAFGGRVPEGLAVFHDAFRAGSDGS